MSIKYTYRKPVRLTAAGYAAIASMWAFLLSLALLTPIGWVANVVWLIHQEGEATTQFWISLAGTLMVPLGVIHGWIVLLT